MPLVALACASLFAAGAVGSCANRQTAATVILRVQKNRIAAHKLSQSGWFPRGPAPLRYTSRMLDHSKRIFTIFISFRLLSALLFSGVLAMAAPPSRITRPLDPSRTVVVAGRVHSRAQPQFDRGAVDPGKKLNYMML